MPIRVTSTSLAPGALLPVLAAACALLANTATAAAGTGPECATVSRVRATSPEASELRLQLDVPAYRLRVIEHDEVTRVIPVAVGQPKYPTPIGRFAIDYVIWNPWWRPPASAWARKEHVTPPGWNNPVGRVKLHVTELVFLHGTPLEDSRGAAASHACVRLSNRDAIALARLVHRYASPNVSTATLDGLEADTSATRTIPLQKAVPIEIRYRLAEVAADDLVVYRDIYRLGGRRVPTATASAITELLQHGRDTSALRWPVLRQVVSRARRHTTTVPLDSLFPTPRPSDDTLPPRYTPVKASAVSPPP